MKFTTGEIISVGTGILACEMGGVYRILNFLTADSLFTHQLPRALRACKEQVLEQCPWLHKVDAALCTREGYPVGFVFWNPGLAKSTRSLLYRKARGPTRIHLRNLCR